MEFSNSPSNSPSLNKDDRDGVLISDLKKHRSCAIYACLHLLLIYLVLVSTEKIYETLKIVFEKFPNTSKFVNSLLGVWPEIRSNMILRG